MASVIFLHNAWQKLDGNQATSKLQLMNITNVHSSARRQNKLIQDLLNYSFSGALCGIPQSLSADGDRSAVAA